MRRSRVRLLVAAPVLSEPTFVLDWRCGGKCSRSSNEFLSFGGIPERSKGSDCKSDGYAFEGSNPSPATNKGGSVVVLNKRAIILTVRQK